MISFHQLFEAYIECRNHKRNTTAALAFEVNLEDNLVELYRELTEGRYRISRSIAFVVEKPVRREVFAADFRDRVVHHLLIKLLMPHFEREFIYDSYACRPGRGTLFGMRRIRRFISQCSGGYAQDCYVLKCDISGFFMNIDRGRLWMMLEQFIDKTEWNNDAEKSFVQSLTRQIVMHNPIEGCHINGSHKRWDNLPANKSLFGVNNLPMPNGYSATYDGDGSPKGLPIGNLTSQWFGNFYLNRLDHYVKHTLGVRYYGRYVDDFVIIHPDKEYLKEVKRNVESFVRDKLLLELHPRKCHLQHYTKGVLFLGVTIKGAVMLTGRRTKGGFYDMLYGWNRVARQRLLTPDELKQVRDSTNSYWGLMQHHNSYHLRRRMARRFASQIVNRTQTKDGYSKIVLRDYTLISGNRAIPYVEWWKLFENNK